MSIKMSAQDDGFSLLEALVALVIFSLAAMALLSVQSESARAVVALEDKFIAEIVAENILVSHTLMPDASRTGERTGVQEMGGRTWRWTLSPRRMPGKALIIWDVSVTSAASGQLVYSISSMEGTVE